MSRELPILVDEAKDSAGQQSYWLIDITLKEDGDYEEEPFYFSDDPVTWNSHIYTPLLRSKPQVKKILGGQTDGGSVKFDNTDFEFGQKVLAKDRYVEGSKVVIYKAWKVSDGTVQADEVFNGILSGATLAVSGNGVDLKLTGDIYDPKAVMGAFPLAQRCVFIFRDPDTCGWLPEQGGDPLFCGKTEDDCFAHFNRWRMGALPFFANITIQVVATSQESSGYPLTGRQREAPEIDQIYPVSI